MFALFPSVSKRGVRASVALWLRRAAVARALCAFFRAPSLLSPRGPCLAAAVGLAGGCEAVSSSNTRADEPLFASASVRAGWTSWDAPWVELRLDGTGLPTALVPAFARALGSPRWGAVSARGTISGHATIQIHLHVRRTVRPFLELGATSHARLAVQGLEVEGLEGAYSASTLPQRASARCRSSLPPPSVLPTDPRGRRGPSPAAWEEIARRICAERAPPLLRALVRVREDPGLGVHPGVDATSLVHAAGWALREGRLGPGASTVPMQTWKMLALGHERTVRRKVDQVALALLTHDRFSAESWLEIYLRSVELGPGVYGVGPGALFWFGRPLGALTPHELAVLVVALPQPRAHARERLRAGAVPEPLAREAWRALRAVRDLPTGLEAGPRVVAGAVARVRARLGRTHAPVALPRTVRTLPRTPTRWSAALARDGAASWVSPSSTSIAR